MPRLLMFAPCEKVIVSQEENSASLIGILQGYNVQVPATQMPPSQSEAVMLPVTWYVFSLWEQQAGDGESTYKQRFELLGPPPGRRKLLVGEAAVLVLAGPDKRYHRMYTGVQGFPLAGEGDYELRLFLSKDAGEFGEVASFAIPIKAIGTKADSGPPVSSSSPAISK